MSIYDDVKNNMLAIDNANPNHNYKYYMRVLDGSNTYVSDYIDIEDFCEQNKLIVLGFNRIPSCNDDLFQDVYNFVDNSLDVDLWNSLLEYCHCGKRISQTDCDEIEARISHDCDINFSLEEFFQYLKDENDDLDIMLAIFILSKKNDVMYHSAEIHGASQGDCASCYYPEGTDEEVIRILEAAFFNLGDEVFICPWNDVDDGGFTYIFVSCPLNRDYLEFVMNETGCKRDEIYIECFDGYEYIPKYRHLEFK